MSISSTANKIQYEANGSNKIFAFPYKFFEQTDLEVHVTDLAGEDEIQTISTDYTVSGIAGSFDSGGNVTFVTAPTASYIVTIYRQIPITQDTDYQDYSEFPADVFENDLDRRAMVEQQINEKLNRLITVLEELLEFNF